MNKIKFDSYFKDIEKELDKQERAKRFKATKYLKKKLKQKAVQRFGADSNITKGVLSKNKILPRESIVGLGDPAQHAHLIEFGTDNRFQKNGKGTGHVSADPFVFPLFNAEAGNVERILQEEWF